MDTYDPHKFYLNVGAGLFARNNWRIMDIVSAAYPYDKHLIDFHIDLLKCERWDIADLQVELMYSSHCLEHLGDVATEHVLKEAYRVLKPGGFFRITVPVYGCLL